MSDTAEVGLTSRHAEKMPIGYVTDRLLHASLRSEPDIFYRARVLVRLLLTLNGLMVLAIITNLAFVLSSQSKGVGIAISASFLIGNFFLIYLIARRGNYRVCALGSLLLSFVIIIAGIVVSGGIVDSPATQMLMVPPLMAYYFSGMRAGNMSVIAVIALVALFYLAHHLGFTFSMRANHDAIQTTRLVASFICVTAVSAMALFFEKTAANLKRQRDADHRRALALAETDMLTGVSNRRSFDALLDAKLRSVREFVLFYIDLDGFKPINDQHGHGVGDEVLCTVAQRLRHIVRERDAVGRLGGDEFALLLDMGSNAIRLQQMALRTLEALSAPMQTTAGAFSVGVSIGIACYPQHARDADGLKKAADNAMYVAKRGQHGWRIAQDHDATVSTS